MTSQIGIKRESSNFLPMLIALLCILGACDSNFHTPPQDRDSWVNPADMINYDSSTKTMTKNVGASKASTKETMAEIPVNCDEVLQPCQRREKEILQKLKTCQDHLEVNQQEQPVSHAPFFKQFAKYFVKKIKVNVEEHDTIHYSAHIQLSGADLATLNRFASNEGEPPQSSHAILTRMITELTYLENYQEPTLNDMIGEFFGGCQNIIILSLCIVIVLWLCTSAVKIHLNYGYSYFYIFLILVMFMFVISVPWNWWHLYKKKVAERQASNIMQVPEECLGGTRTTTQSLFEAVMSMVTFRHDQCVKFHESLLIDPIWEVSPTKAIAVTITKFFLEPLEHIGHGISLLIRNMLQDLPLTVWPIALLILFIFTLLVLTMLAGYRINFFHLIQVGPGERQPQAIAPNAEANRVQELTSQVSHLTRRLEAAESERMHLEYTRTEGRVMVVGPPLPALQSAASVEPETRGESLASGDGASSNQPPEESPVHHVSSGGDSTRRDESIPDIADQETSDTDTDTSTATSDKHEDKEHTDLAIKTEIVSVTAKFTSECTESGTDSDIEIISQDDMNKL